MEKQKKANMGVGPVEAMKLEAASAKSLKTLQAHHFVGGGGNGPARLVVAVVAAEIGPFLATNTRLCVCCVQGRFFASFLHPSLVPLNGKGGLFFFTGVCVPVPTGWLGGVNIKRKRKC
jgi:hypothetical protein